MLLMKIISPPSCFNLISLAELCFSGLEEICLTTSISLGSQTELDSFNPVAVWLLTSTGITALPPPKLWRASSRKGGPAPFGRDRPHNVSGRGFAHLELNYELYSSSQICGSYIDSLCKLQSAPRARGTAKAYSFFSLEQVGLHP